jgi:hypothetical protein
MCATRIFYHISKMQEEMHLEDLMGGDLALFL